MADPDGSTALVLSDVLCKQCGGEIWTTPRKDGKARGKKFCSPRCNRASHSVTGKTREQLAAECSERHTHTCKSCGVRYVNKRKRKHEGTTFCSRECAFGGLKALYSKLPAYTRLYAGDCNECNQPFVARYKNGWCSDECRKKKARMDALVSYIRRGVVDRSQRDCKHCGSLFVPDYGNKRRSFCSALCASKHVRRKYGASHRRRARRYGVEYEPVNRLKVFERDGWRCQICGCSTPRSRQGKQYKNSPELDHRVPMSKGGGHLYSNTQCACRECNGMKSNRSSVGQLPLINTV